MEITIAGFKNYFPERQFTVEFLGDSPLKVKNFIFPEPSKIPGGGYWKGKPRRFTAYGQSDNHTVLVLGPEMVYRDEYSADDFENAARGIMGGTITEERGCGLLFPIIFPSVFQISLESYPGGYRAFEHCMLSPDAIRSMREALGCGVEIKWEYSYR